MRVFRNSSIGLFIKVLFTPLFAIAAQDDKIGNYQPQIGNFNQYITLLVKQGNYQKALKALESRDDLKDTPEGLRLRVQFLIALKRNSEALILLEKHLTQYNDDAIARFQLGEIHFNAHHDKVARLNYQMALSGQLNNLQREIALSRIEELDLRRPLYFWANFEIIPDSNFNSATNANEIDIFGLPFVLDENAKRKSGITAHLNLGLRNNIVINDDFSWQTEFVSEIFDAPKSDFDFQAINIETGPEKRIKNGAIINVKSQIGRQFFGGDVLEDFYGIGFGLQKYDNNKNQNLNLSLREFKSKAFENREGNGISIDYQRTKFKSVSRFSSLGFGLSRRKMKYDTESYNQAFFGFSRVKPFYFNTVSQSQISFSHRQFDAKNIAYDKKRHETNIAYSINFSMRDKIVFGAHPYVGVEVSKNFSNIPIYDYQRTRAIFGFKREF